MNETDRIDSLMTPQSQQTFDDLLNDCSMIGKRPAIAVSRPPFEIIVSRDLPRLQPIAFPAISAIVRVKGAKKGLRGGDRS